VIPETMLPWGPTALAYVMYYWIQEARV